MKAEKDQELSRLFVLAQNGDKMAYSNFLKEVAGILKNYLGSRVKEADRLDDIVQDTLMIIHKARHTYLPERPVGPWIYAICNHRMIDFYRKHRRVEKFEEQIGDESYPEIPEQPYLADSGSEVDLNAELLKLPETQRSVIRLLKLEGHSVKHVANQLGMSESNVKTTAHRGYETLRKKMGVTRL